MFNSYLPLFEYMLDKAYTWKHTHNHTHTHIHTYAHTRTKMHTHALTRTLTLTSYAHIYTPWLQLTRHLPKVSQAAVVARPSCFTVNVTINVFQAGGVKRNEIKISQVPRATMYQIIAR